jgi:hypothetical protein
MSMAKMTIEELQAEVERLQGELGTSEKKRTEAEEMAMAVAQASPFMSNTEEQPTGNTVKVLVCLNPWERDEKKQKSKTVELPTYFYAINLPAGAGTHLATNGIEYYHGQTYEFDPTTLAEMKSRVARCWDHEKSIHGGDENAYRKPTKMQFGGRPN